MSLFKRKSKLPPLSLLSTPKATKYKDLTDSQSKVITEVIKKLKYDASLESTYNASRFYQYRYKLKNGSTVKNTAKLARAIAQELDINFVRVEVERPQNGRLIIEIPKDKGKLVSLREVLESPEYKEAKGELLFPVGKQADGKFYIADFYKLPHIMAGGQTGSGKSTFSYQLILSLLFRYSSDHVQFILIDPKYVEFRHFNGLPHMQRPAIHDPEEAKEAVEWLLEEMERRFETLAKSRSRDIDEFNKKNTEKMPFIVLIIDEVADLMMIDGKYFEKAFIKLLQMSRAVGIHIYMGTSRPSVDVYTGILRANLPTKLAFTTASAVDSRTILDQTGAELLLGMGDLLFYDYDMEAPIRLQEPFVSDDEVDKVAKYINK